MRDPIRRPAPARHVVLAGALALAVAACGSPGPTSNPSSPGASPTAGASGTPTEVPGGASPPPPPTVTPTTATPWGPIWDSLPAAFPRFPGSVAGVATDGPASAVLDAPAAIGAVVEWYQEALEMAAYSTLSLSGPLEDGSFVIESVGATPACAVETTLRPQSGSTTVTILYGAGCPAPAG